MYELYRLLGIHKVNTTAYHPRTDGMVERFNRTLTDMLAKTAESDPRNWDKRIPHVLFAYRTSPHKSTGITPFKLLYGREATLSTEELLFPVAERAEVSVGTYFDELTTHLSEAWALAQDNIGRAQAHQKKNFDKRAELSDYRVGDRVLLHMPSQKTGEMRKLSLPNKGPYRITKVLETGVMIVPEDRPRATPLRVNWERLRRCPDNVHLTRPADDEESTQTGPTAAEDDGKESTSWSSRLRPRVATLYAMRTSKLERGKCNGGNYGCLATSDPHLALEGFHPTMDSVYYK